MARHFLRISLLKGSFVLGQRVVHAGLVAQEDLYLSKGESNDMDQMKGLLVLGLGYCVRMVSSVSMKRLSRGQAKQEKKKKKVRSKKGSLLT